MPKQVFETPRPMSESGLWGLLVDFYRERGPDAWRSGKVPFRMTSNGYLADVYASVAGAFLRDWSRGGGKETPLILEVGGGNGLFAWLFLNRLMRHQAPGEAVPGFDYLLTDAAASNVQAWREISRLRHLVDAGPLDTGVLRIGGEISVETSSPKSWTELELTSRPVVLIANYVMDSVPCEMVRIREGRVFQELVALERADGKDEDIDAFQGLTSRFESQELLPPYTGHAGVNEVLDGYRELPGEACIPVPLETIAFLETFLASDFPFLMLAGDIAYTTPEFEREPPLNPGELVRIDIDAGNAEFLGRVGTPGDIGPAWTGISFDPNGDLFVSSSQFSEIPELGCQGLFGSCAHIYKIDPTNGALVAEMGTTGFGHVSDIDFLRTTLYANFDDKTAIFGTGGVLATIDPVSGAATPVGTGFGPADLNRNLLNGGLSVDPVTCDIWVVERNNRVPGQDNRIFRVDPNTGEALPPTVPLGLGGNPAGFGLDALEILPDGRFIGTRAGFSSSSSNVYLINPEPAPSTKNKARLGAFCYPRRGGC